MKDVYFHLPPTVTALLQVTSLEGNILLWGLINANFMEVYLELLYFIFEITYGMLYESTKGDNMTHQEDYRSVMVVLCKTGG